MTSSAFQLVSSPITYITYRPSLFPRPTLYLLACPLPHVPATPLSHSGYHLKKRLLPFFSTIDQVFRVLDVADLELST